MNLYITKSTWKNKKYDLLDSNTRYLLSCGASMYSDYTIHKDEARRQRYISRHQKNQDFNKKAVYILPLFGLAGCYGIYQHCKIQFAM